MEQPRTLIVYHIRPHWEMNFLQMPLSKYPKPTLDIESKTWSHSNTFKRIYIQYSVFSLGLPETSCHKHPMAYQYVPLWKTDCKLALNSTFFDKPIFWLSYQHDIFTLNGSYQQTVTLLVESPIFAQGSHQEGHPCYPAPCVTGGPDPPRSWKLKSPMAISTAPRSFNWWVRTWNEPPADVMILYNPIRLISRTQKPWFERGNFGPSGSV